MKTTLVIRFMIKSILWLILLLPLWYWAARWFAAPAIWLAGTVTQAVFPWADSWHQEGVNAVLHTLVQVRVPGTQADMLAELSPSVSYPTYGYGLVLFWAMMLSSHIRGWWYKAILGSLLLLPGQAWGIVFQWLRDVVLLSGAYGSSYLQYPSWAINGIAYGYQFGFLMLPPVLPILLWLAFSKNFVASLWLEAALDGGHD